ncbi:MAG: TetR/AcrR family transcriptional regulator [Pontixanthobacter sp.]
MVKPRLSRETLLPLLAGHVLEHGLSDASLRPMAKAAGTSDRMLLYHFGSKDRLVEALLVFLANNYANNLETAFAGPPPKSRSECAKRILDASNSPEMAPFLSLWWQIVAGAARGDAAYLVSAQAIMATLLSWLERQMPPGDLDPRGGARYLLTLIEGAQMLRAIGSGDIAEAGFAVFAAEAD